MATIRPGEGISRIAGSTGDHVYSSWKGKGVLRAKSPARANPASPRQATARAGTAAVAKAWNNDLNDDQQAQWNEAAQAGSPADDPASSHEPGSRQVIPQPGPVLSGYDEFLRRNLRAILTAIRAIGNPILVPSPSAPCAPTLLVRDEAPPIPINWALSLNGLDEDVQCADVLDYEYTSAFSWEFWFWRDSGAASGFFLAKMVPSPLLGYNVQWTGSSIYFQIRRAVTAEILSVRRVQATYNAYRHVVVTYDGSNNANGMKIYLQNVVGQIVVSNVPITASLLHANPLTFASNGAQPFTWHDGRLDCIRNYNRVVTGPEVATLFNGGAGLFGHDPFGDGSCQGAWMFCTGGGNTLYDISGNNYHGTLRNMDAGNWIPGKVPCPDIPGTKQLEWNDPDDLPVGGKIRVWCLSYDAGVHRQQVATIDRGVEAWIPDFVRIAQGATVPIANMPGHYLFQIDAVSPNGNVSPPSNTIEAVCPLV